MEVTLNQGLEGFVSSRLQHLARRVADAARLLCAQGKEPTARAVRTAIHGGSPNEIGPLLRSWRESPEGKAALRSTGAGSPLPPEITELCAEFWLRVSIAAQLDATDAVRSVESESTQAQLKSLRDQLQRELVKYGELFAQSARHEAGARKLALQLDESEARERRQLRDLGAARARIVELEATVEQLKAAPPHLRAARKTRSAPARAKGSPPRAAKAKRRRAPKAPARKPKSRSTARSKKSKPQRRRKPRAGRR